MILEYEICNYICHSHSYTSFVPFYLKYTHIYYIYQFLHTVNTNDVGRLHLKSVLQRRQSTQNWWNENHTYHWLLTFTCSMFLRAFVPFHFLAFPPKTPCFCCPYITIGGMSLKGGVPRAPEHHDLGSWWLIEWCIESALARRTFYVLDGVDLVVFQCWFS